MKKSLWDETCEEIRTRSFKDEKDRRTQTGVVAFLGEASKNQNPNSPFVPPTFGVKEGEGFLYWRAGTKSLVVEFGVDGEEFLHYHNSEGNTFVNIENYIDDNGDFKRDEFKVEIRSVFLNALLEISNKVANTRPDWENVWRKAHKTFPQ